MDKVAVVVLNWNQAQLTIECLRSVLKSRLDNKMSLEVVVVDNGSTDKDINLLTDSRINEFTLIKNKENLGFTGGNNVGIKYALKNKADYVFILNNDTVVKDDCILELGKAFSRNENMGIVAPKIYYAPGFEFHQDRYRKSDLGKVIWSAGGKIDWNNILGQHIGVDEVDKGQFNIMKQVDFVSGCAMMVKKEVFEKIGLLDDRYFLYLEDLDFCHRVAKLGFKILFNPEAIIYHKNAGSSGSGSKLQEYYITRNRLLFGQKYASLKMKLLLLKEALRELMGNNKVKKEAIKDFFLRRFGYKNINTIE